jgi:hypothetical protein
MGNQRNLMTFSLACAYVNLAYEFGLGGRAGTRAPPFTTPLTSAGAKDAKHFTSPLA